MLSLRRSAERGHADHGWIRSYHSFSFAGYHDPAHLHWGNLLALNEERLAAGKGLAMHLRRDTEILLYVLAGALGYEDAQGHASLLEPGGVQRISAGSGVRHRVFNHAPRAAVHYIEIWIEPERTNLRPSRASARWRSADRRGRLVPLATPDAAPGALGLHADARVHAGLFDRAQAAALALDPGRKAYVHLVSGRLRVNGQALHAGDAALLTDEVELRLNEGDGAEVLVFDLAP